MSALPIIIDCDPGIDDAIALLSAFVSRAINDVEAINGSEAINRSEER